MKRHVFTALAIGAVAPGEGLAGCPDAAEGCKGLTFNAVYTGEPIRNVRGGIEQGTHYLDNLDLQFSADRGHVFGIPGLSAFLYVLHNNSTKFTADHVGDLQVVSNIDAPEAWRFYEAWLDWSSDGGGLSTRFGLYDLNTEFDASDTSSLFVNSSHGMNPSFSLTGLNGPSIFPVTSLALRLRVGSGAGFYGQAAVLDGVPGDPDDPSSDEIDLSSEDGALLVAEAGYSAGAWRKLALGGWLYTADFDTLTGTTATGEPQRDDGNGGFYGIADRTLASGDGGELAGFLRLGYGNGRFNEVQYYAGGGLTLTGFWQRRAADQLGLAFASAFNGGDYKDAERAAGNAVDDHETVYELTYRAPITDWLTLQPDLQYVVNPGTDPEFNDCIVVGLRFEIAFSGLGEMPSGVAAELPILAALPELNAALAAGRNAVLHAPPGAGKSTGVPPALLGAPWLGDRRIVMLEPRRLATRAVADRMAYLRGERVGETVGYRMRMDTKVGARTRIEVVTEGILARQLQRDPALEGVGCVIFDEYHERSLQADLGLALVLDAQRHLRPDLRILVMSATLDTEAVARLLGAGSVVTSAGLAHPVETRYAARPSDEFVDRQAGAAVLRALREEPGDILVFLPGAAEIRRVEAALVAQALPAGTRVLPLFGDLSHGEQDLAIRPSPAGERKVVLATNIAETSLTIEGVRVVIDGGLERRLRFDPASGMSRLETMRISRASADQRRGRAGRLAPGVCYRLWSEAQQRALAAQTTPEIVEADLAPLALELAVWGAAAAALSWLDPPPAATLAQAGDLLRALGALDATGRVTPHGREMAALGAHPRLAHMLLRSREAGVAATGCALAALLTERDVLRGRDRDADVRARLEILKGPDRPENFSARRARRAAESFRRQLGVRDGGEVIDADEAGWLLACAYPDRIGRWREARSGRYQLSNGRGAAFGEPQALASSEFIVVAELDAGEREARIFIAAPLTLPEIEGHFGADIDDADSVTWSSREQAVLARRQRRLGDLILADSPQHRPDQGAILKAMIAGIRELGIEALPWTKDLRTWQARALLMRTADSGAREPWPDVSDAALMASLEDWLAPWLEGVSRRDHLARVKLAEALHALLGWDKQRRLDEQAPTHIEVPSGSRIPIDYLDGPVPSLSVRLQEVFGLKDTPRIAGGRVPVMMKLLSPARRPVQVTQDLKSFWERGYHEVKKELKGRYPRHYWPDDPWQAQPTRRVRPR